MLARRKAQTGQEQPPFATVVTDLTSCHPTWFHKAVTTCFVPTQEARVVSLPRLSRFPLFWSSSGALCASCKLASFSSPCGLPLGFMLSSAAG